MIVGTDSNITSHVLLERIRREREALAGLWSGLTEEEMILRPGPQDDWSVKDLIARVAWWECFVLERVSDLVRGLPSKPAEQQDVLNRRTYEQNKDRPLADVLAGFQGNWPRITALISPLSVEQINTPLYYQTYDGVALLPIIEAGTCGHYPSHAADLRAYARRARAGRQ